MTGDQPWLATYPSGLPAKLEPGHGDMLALWKRAAAVAADGEAIRYFDGSLSYRDVDGLSDSFAVWLSRQGVARGDRLGVILQNTPHAMVAILAAWKLGAVPVPGNPMYQASELAKLFADYGPAAVVCHDDHAATVRQALEAIGAATPVATVSCRDFQTRNDPRVW